MAIGKTVAKLVFTGDAKQYNQTLKSMEKNTDSSMQRIKQMGNVLGGVLKGATALGGGLIALYRQQEQAERHLANAIRNSGDASSYNIGELKKMANELQDLNGVGDEASLSMATMGIRMAGLGQEQLPAAIKAAQDYSVATKKGERGTRTFMNALADPSLGISTLKLHTLTEAEEEQIRAMQKAGDMRGAQNILIDAMTRAYGGQAEAMTKGTGILLVLKNALGDVGEGIGKVIWEAIEPFVQWITKLTVNLKNNEGQLEKLGKIFVKFVQIVASAFIVTKLTIAFKTMRGALIGLRSGFNGAKIAAAGFWGAATLGVGTLLAFMPEIISWISKWAGGWDGLKMRVELVWDAIMIKIAEAKEKMMGMFDHLPDFVKKRVGIDTDSTSRQDEINKMKEEYEEKEDLLKEHLFRMNEITAENDEVNAEKEAEKEEKEKEKQAKKWEDKVAALQAEINAEKSKEDQIFAHKLKMQEMQNKIDELQREKEVGETEEHYQKRLELAQVYYQSMTTADKKFWDGRHKTNKTNYAEQLRAELEKNDENLKMENQFKDRMKEIQDLHAAAEIATDEATKAQILALAQAKHNNLLKDQEEWEQKSGDSHKEYNQQMLDADIKTIADMILGHKRGNKVLLKIQQARELQSALQNLATHPWMSASETMSKYPFPKNIAFAAISFAATTARAVAAVNALRKFEKGGMIMGAGGMGDVHPAMLSAGEVVVPTKSYADIERGIASRLSSGGFGGGEQDVHLTVELETSDELGKFIEAKQIEQQELGY